MLILSKTYNDFRDLIINSSTAVNNALKKTKDQLPVNRNADTVDAGASGFVSFLEGISSMVRSGIIPDRKKFLASDNEIFIYDNSDHEKLNSEEKIKYRYCCEALLTDIKYSSNKMSKLISKHGDSMILSGNRRKNKKSIFILTILCLYSVIL